MDALNNLAPETKISDLTVEKFEAVMTRTLCRVADFAAVRFAQEAEGIPRASNEDVIEHINNRADGVREIHKNTSGSGWPKFKIWRFAKPDEKEL